MARSVWTLVDEGVVEHMSTAHERDARAWIANMIATLNITMFVALWMIWHARRKAIHKNIFQSPLSVHYFVQNFIADIENLKRQEKKGLPIAVTAAAPCWNPPPQGHVKINVDAVVGENNGQGAVAAIARSAQGEFMRAASLLFPGMAAMTRRPWRC
jgi:hypothetical protein